jgi:hypothetical protein
MRKEQPFPPHCLTIHTYRELRAIVQAFAGGIYQLLIIIGSPGVGKSEMVARLMQDTLGPSRWGLITGKHSPLDLYERVHHFRTVPIVFDDLDDLLQKAENVMLLKCLCDTCPVKRLQWGSNHALFSGGHLPKSFEAISQVCLICNDWDALNRNVGAVYDRGIVILFQPSALEVHREIARTGWFDDEEVFEFIGRNLFLVTQPSFRFYQIARDHKRADLDWKNLVLRTIEANADPKLMLMARLLADARYESMPAPETAREQAFKEVGGGSRATYHRFKAELLAKRGDIDQAVGQASADLGQHEAHPLAFMSSAVRCTPSPATAGPTVLACGMQGTQSGIETMLETSPGQCGHGAMLQGHRWSRLGTWRG